MLLIMPDKNTCLFIVIILFSKLTKPIFLMRLSKKPSCIKYDKKKNSITVVKKGKRDEEFVVLKKGKKKYEISLYFK